MSKKTAPHILIIDESIIEASNLMILLSPLTKNITVCTDYLQGEAILKAATESNTRFSLIFMAFPPHHHDQIDTAVQVLALAFQNSSPEQTIIVGGEKLPLEFSDTEKNEVLTKPISRKKLMGLLTPLGYNLSKLNCWEFMNCGRQKGGRHAEDQGICSAATEDGAENIHSGCKGGRVCWTISGTMCGGKVQGSFASKIENCMECDFYNLVKTEEGDNFGTIDSILRCLKRKGVRTL